MKSILSTVSLVFRNRKFQLLIAGIICLVLSFHAVQSQGIKLDTRPETLHSRMLTYATVSDTIKGDRIVTDLQIKPCVRGFKCSAPKPSSPSSVWEEIPTKLNLFPINFSIFNYYMFVEKTPKNEVNNYVLDIKFTPTNEKPGEVGIWRSHKVSQTLYIWINFSENPEMEAPVVRDVNVLFGTHDMKDSRKHWRYYYEPIDLPLKQSVLPHISVLAISVKDETTVEREEFEFETLYRKNSVIVTPDPTFKILQMSDLHVGQDMGRCVDSKTCSFDVKTTSFMANTIKAEGDVKLVVFTGDVIDYHRTRHPESAILKALSPVLEAGIPFIFTFGDSDWDWDNYQSKINILNFVASLPKSYNRKYEDVNHRIRGLTNENLRIFMPKLTENNEYDYNSLNLNEPNAVVTVLDSEYAEVDATQSNFLYRIHNSLVETMENRLLFFHYPLPNFRPEGTFKLIGAYNEHHKLATDTDKKFLLDAVHCKYKSISVGHEHENDACIWKDVGDKTVLLCYSGITGDSGMVKIDENFKRRMRVFEMNFKSNQIYSWKRLINNEIIDPQAIFPLNQPR